MICDYERCTGCGACEDICPINCISMKENDLGFKVPFINKAKCINCGLCKRVCINNNSLNLVEPQKCFAAYIENDFKRMDSASGGIGNLLYECFLTRYKNALVSGVAFDNDFSAKYFLRDCNDDLNDFKGSKYVQADSNDIYKIIANELKEKNILFIGMPCQVAALKNYLKIKKISSENLLTVDLLCHGVSPNQYLQEEIEYLKCKYGWDKIKRLTFRSNKRFRNYHMFMKAQKGNKIITYNRYAYEDPYFYGFLKGITLRESCYSCLFANSKRCGDITIGDFIGLAKMKSSTKYNGDTKNTSMVLCNTPKGLSFFEKFVAGKCNNFDRPYQEAYEGGSSLQSPFMRHNLRSTFSEKYKKGYFVETMEEIASGDLRINRKKLKLKRVLGNVILSFFRDND